MVRWAPDARGRLARAAVELFTEQGFGDTTVPQIAERAGLTTRTFFRHFADKREVLFDGDQIPATAAAMMREAPADLDPMTFIADRMRTVARTTFEGNRADTRRVRAIIEGDPQLRERDGRKRTELAAAVRQGFRDRGEDDLTAALLGDLVVTVLHIAVERWLDDPADDETARPLAAHIDEVLSASRSLLR